MERVQEIDSNLKFKGWVKQVLAVGGICFLFLSYYVNIIQLN